MAAKVSHYFRVQSTKCTMISSSGHQPQIFPQHIQKQINTEKLKSSTVDIPY